MKKMDIHEIFASWVHSFRATPEMKQVAEHRLKICEVCEHREHRKIINSDVCKLCGCPISKKIFSPKGKSACPDSRWEK